ncbi:MAG: polyprenyl synthetase family protein [Planctomycetota bacterium]
MSAAHPPESFLVRRAAVEAALAEVVAEAETAAGRIARGEALALRAPGKRVRPVAAILAGEALGASREEIMPFAVAVELVHTASLILDDLPAMDDAELRRGRPTLHREIGEADAILVGVSLVSRAFAAASRAGRTRRPRAGLTAELVAILDRALGARGMCEGQAADLAADPATADFAALEAIHRMKTGALFTAALEGASRIAGAGAAETDALGRFGRNLGLAFQIADDVLDLAGNPDKMGKDVARDHGRRVTFVSLFGIEESRRAIGRLHRTAEEALAPLGRRGADLIALARYLEAREG